MEKCAFYHKAKSQYAYALDKNTLHIKVKTKKDDVEEVKLVYGDPYDFVDNRSSGNLAQASVTWNISLATMDKFGSDGDFDYWHIFVKPPYKRIKYAFLMRNQEERLLYGEKKTVSLANEADTALKDQSNYFAFPFLNEIDLYDGPEWAKEVIWYQIFPERFANGDTSNDNEGTKQWGTPITSTQDFYGGDIQGIMDHIAYMKDLGITGIYLTPILYAPSNHKYDTIDYMLVDPHFGSNELFKEFVALCHDNGIKVMFDVVFNHSGYYFEPFQDVLKNQEQSIYKDWFHIKQFPVRGGDETLIGSTELDYHTFAFTPFMPKLNTENKDVKAMLFKVVKYWSELGIDAWRLDVSNEVDHQFWREFKQLVRSINKEALILGEIWHDATAWLGGEQFDSVMNYPLYDAMIHYFATEDYTSSQFKNAIDNANFNYAYNVNQTMYNLLGSHDTARIKNMAQKDSNRVKLAFAFMFTHVGAPSIYYGDEIGMEGDNDPDCRRCMIWNEEEQDLEMLSYMKKLIQIRKDHPVLSYLGHFRWIDTSCDEVLVYSRYTEDEVYYLIVNKNASDKQLILNEMMQDISVKNLLDESTLSLEKEIALKPYEFIALKKL